MRLWLNGTMVDDPQAPAVSALDHGFTVGDGAFETIKLIDGRPFALTRHLARLTTSAVGLGLPKPDLDLVRSGVEAVTSGWDTADGRLRITYTGGPGPLGSERGDAPPTVAVGLVASPPRPESTGVAVVPWSRNETGALTGLKTTSYAENVVALQYAVERGGTEALLANTRGELCEGTGSNIFAVVDGRLITPPMSSGCLAGITRALVLQWYGGEEVDMPISVLETADELFLTSTTRDVQAIDSVVGHDGDQRRLTAPGPITAAARDAFAARSAADIDP